VARKPNYDFEKRQKEIAKKAKKEEKKKRKTEDEVLADQGTPVID
jgi:hypothetical protein